MRYIKSNQCIWISTNNLQCLTSPHLSVGHSRAKLTLWPCNWTFKRYHVIYVKCEYFKNQKKSNVMKYTYTKFCREINCDCAASLRKYNEIYLLIKNTKSFLWREQERLSYVEDAWFLKVNAAQHSLFSRLDLPRCLFPACFSPKFCMQFSSLPFVSPAPSILSYFT